MFWFKKKTPPKKTSFDTIMRKYCGYIDHESLNRASQRVKAVEENPYIISIVDVWDFKSPKFNARLTYDVLKNSYEYGFEVTSLTASEMDRFVRLLRHIGLYGKEDAPLYIKRGIICYIKGINIKTFENGAPKSKFFHDEECAAEIIHGWNEGAEREFFAEFGLLVRFCQGLSKETGYKVHLYPENSGLYIKTSIVETHYL